MAWGSLRWGVVEESQEFGGVHVLVICEWFWLGDCPLVWLSGWVVVFVVGVH